MKEIELLKSIWKERTSRKNTLIVPVTCDSMSGSLNNEHWYFNVPYAFREALDIRYLRRVKNKIPFMAWTQGPLISFTEGDVLTANNNQTSLQVKFAQSMGWDPALSEMYQGSVVFDEFTIAEGVFIHKQRYSCNQMEFLETLITGDIIANSLPLVD